MNNRSDIDPVKVIAFWGYSFQDETDLQGGITWLERGLIKAIRKHPNITLDFFGDQSVDEVQDGLQIYIPLITSNFLRSDLCLRELRDFYGYEKSVGRSDLIFPIYLKTQEAVAPDPDIEDELAAALHGRPYHDWRASTAKLRDEVGREELIADIDTLAVAIWDRLSKASFPNVLAPPIPNQGTGPHFRINEDGLIDRAPDDVRDSIENEARMASLQAGLQAGCDRLLRAGINPNAFGYLIDDIKAYQDAISPPVQEIQFTDVWRLGLLLHDHADAVSRDVDRLRPSLEDEQQAALNSLVGLHGPFILSSEDGRALQALAYENLATRDELGEFQEAAEAFIQAVEDSTDLVTDQVKDLIVAANQGIGRGRFPERHTATARTANQNFLSVVGKAAAFVGAAAAGAIIGDAVMTASVGREVATIGTQTIEAATNFLVTHEMVLKGLAAASGESLAWLPHLVNWIKAHRSQDNIASDMANRSPGPDFLPRMSGNDPLIQPPGTVFRDVDALWCPEMVVIPPGSFAIGSREDEEGRLENERPRHRVAIKESFALGRYPVTFEEFDFFCIETGREKVDDRGWGRDRRPVINVSWIDAGQYCEWLTEKTGSRYILPSEAWWEYACRAGTTTRFAFGDELTKDQANFGGHVNKTTKVDAYPANAFGLFDMHGNVWEWCEDRYYASYDVALDDGSACVSGDNVRRVVRGGSWSEAVQGLRCACRDVGGVTYRYGSVGFRCARV